MAINFIDYRGKQATVSMSEFASALAEHDLTRLFRRYYRDEDIPESNPELAGHLRMPAMQRLEVRIELLLSDLDEINETYEYLAVVQLADREQPEGITFTKHNGKITFEAY